MGITDTGLKILMDRFLTGGTYTKVEKFKVGIGTAAFNVGDIDLEHAIPINGTEEVDNCDVADWSDSADMTTTLNTTTYKEGSGSLNLTKDGTGSADANTYKTTTSRDFTSKGLSIWIYIKDSTALAKLATSNCLTIRFGSDDSNYYYWQKDLTDLAVGWNLVDNLTSANADGTTGSPAIASCDYTLVQLTADASGTTWSAGDFIMDDIKLVSSDDYLGPFEANYPSINETNMEITYRMVLDSLQANGYLLTEIGTFNTDGTPSIWSRNTFTAISKSNTEEVRFIIKDRFSAN